MNAFTTRQLLKELASQGLLAPSGTGRMLRYDITPAGRLELAAGDFPEDRDVTLSGRSLNALLEAARQVGKQFTGPGREPSQSLTRDQLQQAVLAAFEELRREKHAVGGLVPIHEIRTQIREKLGDAAARHEVFDEAVRELRRNQQFRLVPLTDLSSASAEALQDSIPGTGETFFFLESAHEPVAR